MWKVLNPLITYKPRQSTTQIILHDSHTTPKESSVKDVSRWHLDAYDGALQMGLLGIGYHFIIERDGTRVACRQWDRIGSHTPGFNDDSIGICLVGGRDYNGDPEDNFTVEQRAEAFRLIQECIKEFGPLKIKGRYEIQRFRNKGRPKSPFLDMEMFRADYDIFNTMGVIL